MVPYMSTRNAAPQLLAGSCWIHSVHHSLRPLLTYILCILRCRFGLEQVDEWRNTPAERAKEGDDPNVPRTKIHDGEGVLECLKEAQQQHQAAGEVLSEEDKQYIEDLEDFFPKTLAYHPHQRMDIDRVLGCGLVNRGREVDRKLRDPNERQACLQEALGFDAFWPPGGQLSL